MIKIYFYQTPKDKVCGIVIVPIPGQRPAGKKYNYVDNTPRGINTFISNMEKKFPAATHIDFYCKHNKTKIGTIYLQ